MEDAFKLGYRRFLFRDATFTLNRKRTVEICELLIEKGLPDHVLVRDADQLPRRRAARAAREGRVQGNQLRPRERERRRPRGRARSRASTSRGSARSCDETAKAGIVSHLLVAVGLPQETRASIQETYLLLGELPARSLGVTGITPFPGTELWYDAMRNDWVKSTDWREYGGNGAPMITDNLSQEDMRFAARMMFDYFKMTRPEQRRDSATEIERHRAQMADWVAQGLPVG